jgi:hypothetical protein
VEIDSVDARLSEPRFESETQVVKRSLGRYSLNVGANSRSPSARRYAAIAAALLFAGLLAYLSREKPPSGAETASDVKARAPAVDSPAGLPPRPALAPAPPPSGAVAEDPDAAADPDQGGEPDPAYVAGDAYPVDLVKLRAKLPDNLYWQLGAPTQDPQTLQMRAEEEMRWNELFGKVESNTASEEEIHRYYDHRQKLSEDYIEFASVVLKEYKDKLPERDQGLYELSINLHRGRLAEIPKKTEDALTRKRAADQRREDWQKSGKSQ